jgi:hypothetical protein
MDAIEWFDRRDKVARLLPRRGAGHGLSRRAAQKQQTIYRASSMSIRTRFISVRCTRSAWIYGMFRP